MKNRTLAIFAALAVGMGLSRFASAALIVTPGTDNSGTDNVIENACDGNLSGPALTVQGCLNLNHSFFVNFTSDENLLITGGGQASVVAVDGAFDFLQISLATADWTFSKLLVNIDSEADGFVTFTGSPGGVSSPFALDQNGENKFVLTGEDFSWISFATTTGINSIELVGDLKQTRIGGFKKGGITEEPFPVPEPGMMLLLGSALLGLGLAKRRKA